MKGLEGQGGILGHSADTVSSLWAKVSSAGGTVSDLSRYYGWSDADIKKALHGAGVPGFATGGAFTNGIVSTPTMFSMGHMGEAGPEAIMPLTNIGGSLGIRATMPDNSELIAEVKELQALVARLLYANEATARNTHITSKQLERWDGDGMPEVRDVSVA